MLNSLRLRLRPRLRLTLGGDWIELLSHAEGTAEAKAQLANHPAQTRWHKLGFLTGCLLGCHLGAVSVHFGTMLGWGGDLERPWGPCVPHRCGHTWEHVILASFWGPLGVFSGTLLGPIFGSGSAREGLASHFGPFLGVEGPHSVFTSQADPRNGKKTAILRWPMWLKCSK